ncbi:MAG: hypothetical protein HYY67_08890 [Thaumarchaeota archaeon]|nr:hypothetical protein [Nitrososphaerota archaeon]
MFNIRINRDVKVMTYHFKEVFQGFENCQAVRDTFGEETDKVLDGLGVELYSRKGYMGVSETTGNLIVSTHYLKTGDELSIYLDVIHELVHVRQFREGKDLFDPNYQYVDRPTEIEAYAHSVKEAKRLGMTDDDIMDYLRMEWVTEEEVKRLAKSIGVVSNTKPKRNLVKPTARRPSR